MDDKTRLQHIQLNVIMPKKHGQVRNLYDEDFTWLIKQAEKVEVYERELKRMYDGVYGQTKAVAELVKVRAYIFTCSYKTAWENYLDDDEKYDFTFEQIKEYL